MAFIQISSPKRQRVGRRRLVILDPAAVEIDGGDHSVPTEVADVLAHHFAKAFFVRREHAATTRPRLASANAREDIRDLNDPTQV